MHTYIIKDKNGQEIKQGQRFYFTYLKESNSPIKLIGSFDWNQNELRYEIDVHDHDELICLSYHKDAMSDFELLEHQPTGMRY